MGISRFGRASASSFTLAQRAHRRGRAEESLHLQVAGYLRYALPPETGVVWFHVPNGGARSKAEAGRLKAMGVLAGVYDLAFFWDAAALLAANVPFSPEQMHALRGEYWARVLSHGRSGSSPGALMPSPCVGWIELKSETGRESDVQKEFAPRVEAIGHRVGLARTVEEVAAHLTEWLPHGTLRPIRILPAGALYAPEAAIAS